MNQSYFSDSIENFLKRSNKAIFGEIASQAPQEIQKLQSNAWEEQIQVLKSALLGLKGHIHFEYCIPRIGRRLDNVLIIKDVIFVLEFKTGSSNKSSSSLQQAWDYALDLKYFHEETHDKAIIPIAVTESPITSKLKLTFHQDGTASPINITYQNLGAEIKNILSDRTSEDISISKWNQSSYRPTPTIIEAAKYLYNTHDVASIVRKDASGKNLSETLKAIEKIIEESKSTKKKSIIFVTGVPGAGKTLVGLHLALKSKSVKTVNSVYLSGNRPLVEILRSSLAQDKFQKEKEFGKDTRKKDIERELESVIQNIHNFRNQYLDSTIPPPDHVVVFDEAQRVWDVERTHQYLIEKGKREKNSKPKSEPEILLDIMNKHKDWCSVVCLVGGGQEIHMGEAGLDGWLSLFSSKFKDWNVYLSNEILRNSEYSWDRKIETLITKRSRGIEVSNDFHLKVSQRSFRAEKLSLFVSSLLNNDAGEAQKIYKSFKHKYQIYITRDLKKAKDWLRSKARGSERIGLLASSEAKRLRPHGLVLDRRGIDYNCWYLKPVTDIRSSNFIELPATEFESQGLEIDWSCVCWDSDLRRENDNWKEYVLKGSTWKIPPEKLKRTYLRNSYRVLLTRARQGMIIFVPNGDSFDTTRNSVHLDEIYEFLKSAGIEFLK